VEAGAGVAELTTAEVVAVGMVVMVLDSWVGVAAPGDGSTLRRIVKF
jgi:hypothetical protein